MKAKTAEDKALRELAFRTVADELEQMIRVRPEIRNQVDDDEDSHWVHAFITYAVKDLQSRLAQVASREDIDLREDAR